MLCTIKKTLTVQSTLPSLFCYMAQTGFQNPETFVAVFRNALLFLSRARIYSLRVTNSIQMVLDLMLDLYISQLSRYMVLPRLGSLFRLILPSGVKITQLF